MITEIDTQSLTHKHGHCHVNKHLQVTDGQRVHFRHFTQIYMAHLYGEKQQLVPVDILMHVMLMVRVRTVHVS